MTHSKVYFVFFLVVFVAIAVFIIIANSQKNPYADITDFDKCSKAGFPVMESYPSVCSLPNGKSFVQQVLPEK